MTPKGTPTEFSRKIVSVVFNSNLLYTLLFVAAAKAAVAWHETTLTQKFSMIFDLILNKMPCGNTKISGHDTDASLSAPAVTAEPESIGNAKNGE
jgi:hypothetical protein